jgi:acetoacetyl-CoA synthetase
VAAAPGAQGTRVGQFLRWLERERGLSFDGYDDLWRWSVDALEDFRDAVWQFFGVPAQPATPPY